MQLKKPIIVTAVVHIVQANVVTVGVSVVMFAHFGRVENGGSLYYACDVTKLSIGISSGINNIY
jgi:hypothetical protein